MWVEKAAGGEALSHLQCMEEVPTIYDAGLWLVCVENVR